MPTFPARGAILTVDGAQGSITLDGGQVVGFDCNQCLDFEPLAGKRVRVPIGVEIGDHLEALVVIAEDREPMGDDEILSEQLVSAERKARDLRWWRPSAKAKEARTKPPYELLVDTLSRDALPSSIERLVSPARQAETAKAIVRIEESAGEPFMHDYWPLTSFADAPIPFDPCFVPLGGADGDFVGLWVHPPTAARGELPVLFYSHEHAPMFTLLADGVDDFCAMLDGAPRASAKALATAASPERALVDELCHGQSPARTAAKLAALYRELDWPLAHASISAQLPLLAAEDDEKTRTEQQEAHIQAQVEEQKARLQIVPRKVTIPPRIQAMLDAAKKKSGG